MTSPAQPPRPDSEEDEAYLPPVGPMTFEEYREFQAASDTRHEFVNGFAFPLHPIGMSGGTRDHSRITTNVIGRLWPRTQGTGCVIYTQTFELRAPNGEEYYPGVMVSCAPEPAGKALFLVDPCLIVEVLSPSTERTDFGEKLDSYVQIPTLGAYLIVETNWRAVHRHYRDDTGGWRQELVAGGERAIPLPCPASGVLTLDEIYEGVDLPSEPPSPARLRRIKEPAPDGAYAAAPSDA